MGAGFKFNVAESLAAAEMPLGGDGKLAAARRNQKATTMKRITVLLADDHTIVREGFRHMLELETDFEVVGEAVDGRRAVALAVKLRPAVVLMDIAMPRLNGLEATRQMLDALPSAKVIILSSHNDDALIENAINSGAAGFLSKQTSAQDVCQAVREVYKGKTIFSPAIAKRLGRLHNKQVAGRAGPLKPSFARLTSRQREVLQLIAEGKANKQMAAELGIVLKTAEKHRENLMKKLDIHDTAGLTRYAISAGIIENNGQFGH
jgi:DNA-binding NarL/FixJ family response regulator